MIEYKSAKQKEAGDQQARCSVLVLGIGGAGANALDRIALEGMEEADLICTNTDIRALSTSVANKKIQLGAELTRGLGAGGDPELGREAAMEKADEIRQTVKGHSMIFLCVGLGGGTGSGAAPVIARIAEQEGAFVVVFATYPFSFEGRRRLDQAQTALDQLGSSANCVIVFENDRMGELILAKEGIQKAFAAADKIISQSVRAVTQITTKTGLIHIGLDDLISALRNTNSRCLFGYGRAKGQNRAQAAVKEALKSPLLEQGQLSRATNILVHVCGGESLTLYEVELLMKELGKHLRDDSQIFFGTSTDTAMNDDVGVTLITSVNRAALATSSEVAEHSRRSAAADEAAAEREERAPEHDEVPVVVSEPEPEPVAVAAEARISQEAERASHAPEPAMESTSASDGGANPSVVRAKKGSQQELKLNQGAKGRFEKSEPTIIDGEDLDVPTFLRDRE